ncbi:MAG: M50 family metallopeptidase [Acidimicrobiales bacterium]
MSETTMEPHGGAPRPQPAPGEPPTRGSSWARLALVVALTVAVGVWASLSVVAVIAALVVIIFLHELGHYLTARAAGMKVTEFFIGFGPKLWSIQRGETTYGVKAIPAGAYVRIIGMSNLEEVDPAEEHRTYRHQSYPRRLAVAVAGSAMHFLMAFALVYTILVGLGVPDRGSDRWRVGTLSQLQDGPSPALEAGVEIGDRIVAVDGRRFGSFDDLAAYLRDRPGERVSLVVERDGRRLVLETTLTERREGGETMGFLGIGPQFERVRTGPVRGVVDAAQATGETMWLSVKGLGQVFSPAGISGYLDTLTQQGPEGPGRADDGTGDNRLVSVVAVVQVASQAGSVAGSLQLLFLVNVFLGVFNLVPLLPFDGGHVAIATYERIRSRKGRRHVADVTKLLPLTYAVVVVLAFIFVTTVYLDLANPISVR